MVCHRWTLALILIFVPILVTVISAFRVSLPGRAHEVKSERRHKCVDCGVSDLNLDPVVHSFKKESAKRSFDDIKKVFSDKRYAFEAKFTKKDDKHKDFEDKDEDKDDSDSVKASFERLEKVETKSKLDTKIKTKKVSLILDFNDDDDDDDDSEVEDDDDYDLPKLPDHKKPVVVDTIKKIDEQKSITSVKSSVKPVEKMGKIQDDDKKDKSTTQTEQKIDISTIKTVIKESLKPKVEIEKPVKKTPKLETEIKSDTEKVLKKGIKESDLQKIKIISKLKDTLTKDPTISEPKEKTVKSDEEKVKSKEPKQKSTDKIELAQKTKDQVLRDVSKIKNIPESKKTIEPTSEEKVVTKTETTKSESKESRSHQISDVLHRRNLLHSEFEDFYAFFPTFAPNFSRVHNPECRRHGQILLRQLRGTKLWALNMLDATAKIPSGLLQGNGIQLGDFDQCLGIRARVQLDTGSIVRIQGKYCLAMIDLKAEHPSMEAPVHLAQSRNLFKSRIDDPGHFVPRFSTLSWGVCVPSPCSSDDVEIILRDAVKHYQYKTGLSIRVKVDEDDCYTRKGAAWWKEWLELPTILTLSLYTTVLTLVLIATLQDFLSANNSEEEPSDEGKSEEQEKEEKEEKEKKASDGFLSSFSLYNTLGKLVAPASSGEIVCIHGVRAIATVALLLAHKFLPIGLTPYTNRLKISEIVSSPLLSWCRAGWMFTDCFLLISGTLTSYRKSTSDSMASKLLSRYFRLTPALLAVVLFYAYIWDNVWTGPMWGTLVTKNAEVCRQGWWWNLLYVQNYFGFEDMCAPQTHHMAVDFQLTIVGGILVWAIQSDVPFSSTVMQLLHLLAAYSRYTTFRDHRLTALAYQGVSVSQLYRTGRLSYTSILHRCSPYLIGVSLGLALRKTSSISKLLSFFGWFICITLWGLVLWAGADSGSFDYRYDVTFAAIYATLAPLATALGFAWMIYAVHKNSPVFDASAKSPQGLLFGSSYHLGNFDECVGIKEPGEDMAVEGQYCLATIKWRRSDENTKIRFGRGEALRWAVCVPSACDASAVAGFVGDVLAHTVGNSTGVDVTEKDCYTREPMTISKLDIVFVGILLFFGAVLIFTTSYEIYSLRWRRRKSYSAIHDLIVSFSLINNTRKILSTKQNNSLGLECINGIKALAMIFIIAGHACLFIGSGPVMDAEAWDRLIRDPTNAFMLNNALLVDTFLFLSAFLFSRLLLIELDKRRGRLNVLPILVFRYIRVTPAYIIVILFYMTWLPKIGEGPLWEGRLQLEQERCMEVWWANILYVNNYISTDKMCMFQSWYLAVDTQLFFVAPIFIYSLWHWRRFGPIFTAAATFVSLIIPTVITFKERLDPTLLFYAKEFTDFATNYYFVEAYIRTHMKMTPYFMGILTGYILHRIQLENYEFSNILKAFGWMTSIVLGTVTTFSVSLFYQDWYQYSAIEAAAYISLHKFAWSIANGWLIVACATGNGGVLGKLLTWKFLVPIARLTFCAYLVNGIVELYYVGQLRHPLHITFFTIAANAISHIVLTFFLALILCIIFESPLHGIEKILLRMFARPVLSDNAKRNDSGEASRHTSQSKLEA